MKIKKIFAGILAVCMIFIMTGCSSKPENMSDEMYNTGLNALETIDQYLDGKLDSDEATDKLDRFQALFDTYSDSEEDVLTQSNARTLSMICMNLSYNIVKVKSTPSAMDDLLQSRNELAEKLGEKSR